jgi:hypothetical protein
VLLTQNFLMVRIASHEVPHHYGDSMSYLDVGHEDGPNKELPIIWLYDGSIRKEPVGRSVEHSGSIWGGHIKHKDIWGEAATMNQYHGRYEPWSGKLSVLIPERMRMRKLPKVLVQALHQSFPDVTEIYEHR